jgi:SAM-dependent methyltransferase
MSNEDDDNDEEEFAIRHAYEKYGVNGYYSQYGSDYRNPHEDRLTTVVRQLVEKWALKPTDRVLDLACGSGEITLMLRQLGFKAINGIDPYTSEAFEKRTGTPIHAKWTFEQIADGCLEGEGETYDVIICSFAAHLIAPSYLPLVMIQLRFVAKKLIILTPHKRPQILSEWGWHLTDEFVHERIRARLYTSDEY